VESLPGAGYGERQLELANHRNGYRDRDGETRAGTVELRIPGIKASHKKIKRPMRGLC
jgi:putative transposase